MTAEAGPPKGLQLMSCVMTAFMDSFITHGFHQSSALRAKSFQNLPRYSQQLAIYPDDLDTRCAATKHRMGDTKEAFHENGGSPVSL